MQVCTPDNRNYLLSFLPGLAPKLRDGLRAGIDTARYEFRPGGREPLTMLFVAAFAILRTGSRWSGSWNTFCR